MQEERSGVEIESRKEDLENQLHVDKFYGVEAVNCCSLQCNKKIPKEVALDQRCVSYRY